MPFQWFWQWKTRKFNVQHPAASCTGRTRGRMQQQWTHQQHVACFGLTKNLLMGFSAVLDRFRTQSAQAMRAGQDSQSSVVRVGIVKVQAHSEHLIQQLHRWLHMRHALLHTPWPESWHLGFFFESQRQVLMPRNEPVGLRAFVKIDAAYGNGSERKKRAYQFSQ